MTAAVNLRSQCVKTCLECKCDTPDDYAYCLIVSSLTIVISGDGAIWHVYDGWHVQAAPPCQP